MQWPIQKTFRVLPGLLFAEQRVWLGFASGLGYSTCFADFIVSVLLKCSGWKVQLLQESSQPGIFPKPVHFKCMWGETPHRSTLWRVRSFFPFQILPTFWSIKWSLNPLLPVHFLQRFVKFINLHTLWGVCLVFVFQILPKVWSTKLRVNPFLPSRLREFDRVPLACLRENRQVREFGSLASGRLVGPWQIREFWNPILIKNTFFSYY